MELEEFESIRDYFCKAYKGVSEGKMMNSPAIPYNSEVFAFFSHTNKMVFKLGKTYPMETLDVGIQEFSPFKKKGPLNGWFEVAYRDCQKWGKLTLLALKRIQQ
ncbi:MAG: hypothetical protein AAFZ89_16345, partial [Bacteroidota bacterium]